MGGEKKEEEEGWEDKGEGLRERKGEGERGEEQEKGRTERK